MITSWVRCPDGDVEFDVSLPRFREALGDPRALVWVDVAADERAEGDALLGDVFRFHPLTIDDCYNTHVDPPKVDDYGEYLFIIVHALRYEATGELIEATELDMYVGPNYVVSLHRSPLTAVEEVRRRARNRSLVLDHGPAFLAHALFDVVVDEFHPIVEALDDELLRVEEAVLASPDADVLQTILRLKRNAQRLKRSILPQRDVANRFARGEYRRLVAEDSLIYFRDIYDHTVRVEEMIDGVRDLADSALNTYLSSVNNRTNEVMKALAIVAVVFLPLTLIASVYGTNFEETFPDYGWNGGFYTMAAVFVLIAAGLIAWFRWRRWL